MGVKEYFFSKNNVNYLIGKLCNQLQITDDQDAINSCGALVKKIMKHIFDKSKDILNKGNSQQVVSYLNNETLKQSLKTYSDITNKQKQMGQIGQYSMNRDKEIYGNRKNKVEKRGQQEKKVRQKVRQNELPGIDEVGGGGNYAPIASGNGEFIAADGSMGKKFLLGVNLNDYIEGGGKKGSGGDLMQKLMEKQMQYENEGMPVAGGMSGSGGMPGRVAELYP